MLKLCGNIRRSEDSRAFFQDLTKAQGMRPHTYALPLCCHGQTWWMGMMKLLSSRRWHAGQSADGVKVIKENTTAIEDNDHNLSFEHVSD